MRSNLVRQDSQRTFELVLEPGEEIFGVLEEFLLRGGLAGATVEAQGSFASATLGWYDIRRQLFSPMEIVGDCAAPSIGGTLSRSRGGWPLIHLQASLVFADGVRRGGHLLRGVARQLELTLVETAPMAGGAPRPDRGAERRLALVR